MTKNFVETIELPAGVTATLNDAVVTLKGPKGEVSKKMDDVFVKVAVEGNNVLVSAPNRKRRLLTVQNTFLAHLQNMIRGVKEGYTYKMKICSGHFPMNVTATATELVVKNFIGEKTPRKITLLPGVKIQVAGDDIIIESVDKEVAGQTAASIERLAHRTGFDHRIFQSGIYITNKAGKDI